MTVRTPEFTGEENAQIAVGDITSIELANDPLNAQGWELRTIAEAAADLNTTFADGDQLPIVAQKDYANYWRGIGTWSEATNSLSVAWGAKKGTLSLGDTVRVTIQRGEDLNLDASETVSGEFADARISSSSVVRHEGDLTHANFLGLDQDDHGAVYGGLAQPESITGAWGFKASGAGGLVDYDLSVGDTDGTPSYGVLRLGNAIIGRTSHSAAGLDLDGCLILQNAGAPVTSKVETLVSNSAGGIRLAVPVPAAGSSIYSPDSVFIAGPAPSDDAAVTLAYWQSQGLFDNLTCDTGTAGADCGIQNDLEVEGDIFTNSIKGSTDDTNIVITPHGTGKTSFSDKDIIAVGDMALDSISSAAGAAININLGTDVGDDLNIGAGKLVVEGDSGKVGIGAADPEELLHIKDGGGAAPVMLFESAGGAQPSKWGWKVNPNTGRMNFQNYYTGDVPIKIDLAAPNNSLLIASAGIAVNHTNPLTLFHIQDSTQSGAILRVESTATNGYPAISLKNDAREYQLIAPHGTESDSLLLRDVTASAYRLALDTSGNFGINTISPDAKLQVVGNCKFGDDDTNNVLFGPEGNVTFKGSGGLVFGEISAVNNAVETVITSAGVAVQITVFNVNGPSNGMTPDHVDDHIEVETAGTYFIAVSATINSTGGPSSKFEVTVKKNNGASVVGALQCSQNIAGGGGAAAVISMSGLASLALNDTVECWIENETGSGNYVVEEITLSVILVGG